MKVMLTPTLCGRNILAAEVKNESQTEVRIYGIRCRDYGTWYHYRAIYHADNNVMNEVVIHDIDSRK